MRGCLATVWVVLQLISTARGQVGNDDHRTHLKSRPLPSRGQSDRMMSASLTGVSSLSRHRESHVPEAYGPCVSAAGGWARVRRAQSSITGFCSCGEPDSTCQAAVAGGCCSATLFCVSAQRLRCNFRSCRAGSTRIDLPKRLRRRPARYTTRTRCCTAISRTRAS